MTEEQKKRRDELAYSYEAPSHRNCYGCCQSDSDYENAFKAGYDAGYADAKEEILKLKTALGVAGEFIKRNDELTRKLEMAKMALKKAIEFGEYADWAVDSDPAIQQLDLDARAALKELE